MNAIFWLLFTILDLYFWVIIISAVLSWLIVFGVVNPRHPIVGAIWDTMTRLTDPLLRPIRRLLPDLGGIDISPIILLIGIQFVKYLLVDLQRALLF